MSERADTWPHTRRPLPWLLAGFLAMLFLVPTTSTKLNIPSPVDPYIDRYVLCAIVGVWIVLAWLGRGPVAVPRRPMLFLGATLVFVSIAFLSVALNAPQVASQDLLNLAQNRLVLLIAFVTFGWFAASAMRPGELSNFSILLVALATITAIGVIWERRTGYNVFYELVGGALKPIATVSHSPTNINPDPLVESRKTIVGPTEHGLAVTTMLVMAIPFAIVAFSQAQGKRRWLYAVAMALIVGAALSTERKTAVLTPVAAVLVIAAYRPRAAVRMLPLVAVMGVFIHVISPGALGTIHELQNTFGSDSSVGRSSDYEAISPEFLSHPLLGGGYGTRNIADTDHVRILDNEYLAELLGVGLFGTLAFIGMIIAAIAVAHPAIRSGDPARAGPALAASASCTVFLFTGTLFDSMSFAQAPYVFFFVAAVATVAAAREAHVPADARSRLSGRGWARAWRKNPRQIAVGCER